MRHSLPLACCAAALALAGCVEDNADSGLTVLRNLVPSEGCSVSTDETLFRPTGRIDSVSPGGYVFTPLARNDLTFVDGESETAKTIFVRGAYVTIEFYDKTLFTEAERATLTSGALTRFDEPTSGAIDPGGGLASYQFTVVPGALISMIDAKLSSTRASTLLDVQVRLHGTRAGSEIESNVFHYPVEVCVGCVFVNHGPCASLPDGFIGGSGGACNAYQDDRLDCCEGPNGLVCPAVPPAPSET